MHIVKRFSSKCGRRWRTDRTIAIRAASCFKVVWFLLGIVTKIQLVLRFCLVAFEEGHIVSERCMRPRQTVSGLQNMKERVQAVI